MQFYEIIVVYTICSFAAWVAGNICESVNARALRFNNFLMGPFSPFDGFIYLFALLILHDFGHNPAVFFVLTAAFIFLSKLALSYVDRYLFQRGGTGVRWALIIMFALISALFCLALYYFILPLAMALIYKMPENTRRVASLFINAFFIGVCVSGLFVYSTLRHGLNYLSSLRKELCDAVIGGDTLLESMNILKSLPEGNKKPDLEARVARGIKYEQDILRTAGRFPRLSQYLYMPSQSVKVTLAGMAEDAKLVLRNVLYVSFREDEENNDSFAYGLNFYKLLWIFFIACILGYMIESVFCLVKNGYVESRQGLIYGPFSQIYGFGAVLLSLTLYKIRHMRAIWIFIISCMIGGLFEAACSYIQETAFGTVSWDYTQRSFPLFGGRTNLSYMFFWGFLGTFFIKEIYPRLSKLVERIPNRIGITFSYVMIIFFVFDMFISAAALDRQRARHSGIPPSNAFAQFVDSHYTDEYLKTVYPNMVMK